MSNELPEVAWLIEFEAQGVTCRNVHLHNSVADYRGLDPKARSSVLTDRATAQADIKAAYEAGAAHGASQMKERCANVCEGMDEPYDPYGAYSYAAAIRSLGSE